MSLSQRQWTKTNRKWTMWRKIYRLWRSMSSKRGAIYRMKPRPSTPTSTSSRPKLSNKSRERSNSTRPRASRILHPAPRAARESRTATAYWKSSSPRIHSKILMVISWAPRRTFSSMVNLLVGDLWARVFWRKIKMSRDGLPRIV